MGFLAEICRFSQLARADGKLAGAATWRKFPSFGDVLVVPPIDAACGGARDKLQPEP
jgi:hypothetical protein